MRFNWSKMTGTLAVGVAILSGCSSVDTSASRNAVFSTQTSAADSLQHISKIDAAAAEKIGQKRDKLNGMITELDGINKSAQVDIAAIKNHLEKVKGEIDTSVRGNLVSVVSDDRSAPAKPGNK